MPSMMSPMSERTPVTPAVCAWYSQKARSAVRLANGSGRAWRRSFCERKRTSRPMSSMARPRSVVTEPKPVAARSPQKRIFTGRASGR